MQEIDGQIAIPRKVGTPGILQRLRLPKNSRTRKWIVFLTLVIGSSAFQVNLYMAAQGAKWKQIVVLVSSRSDVERLLGKSRSPGFDGVYDLEEGHLFVVYAPLNFCENGKDFGWDVREDTATEIIFSPPNGPLFSSLNLDLARFKKVKESPCCPDLISYVNKEEGVAYVVNPDGTVNEIRYFPSSQYDHLLCSKKPKVSD